MESNGSQRLTNASLYDPPTNTWTATTNLKRARSDHCAALLASGKVLVVGGGHNVLQAGSEV